MLLALVNAVFVVPGHASVTPTNIDPNGPDWSLSLAAYWAMDGDYAEQACVAGVPADGTLVSPQTGDDFVAGKLGQAANLINGEHIAINSVDENWFDFSTSLDASTYSTATGDLSVSLWCKIDSFDTSWQAVIAKGEGSGWRLARRSNSDGLGYAGGSGDIPNSNTTADLYPVNDNQWHHVVAISENGVSTRLWFDGVPVATGSAPTIENRASNLLIGGNPDANGLRTWDGQIDDVVLWSRVLSETEISLLYNSGAGAPLSNFVTFVPDTDGLDPDGDGLTNLQESEAGTNPDVADTDFDGADDGLEFASGKDPLDDTSIPSSGLQYAEELATGTVGPYLNNALPALPLGGASGGSWMTEDYFTGQGNFNDLKGLASEPNSTYIAVVERRGTVQRVNAGNRAVTTKLQTLDIRDRIVYGDNGGLRSVEFPPDFNVPDAYGEHHVYVFYSSEARSDIPGFTSPFPDYDGTGDPYGFYRLSRFTRNPANGIFDPDSELVMIQQMTRDQGQHFGGGLCFDNDGFLYVTWGDTEFNSGKVGVPFYQDSQRIDRIFQSAILRLDVKMQGGAISQAPSVTLQGNTGPMAMAGTTQSCPTDHNYYHHDNFSGVGYYIPTDNYWVINPPAAGDASTSPAYPAHGPALGEHHAVGARNPWRITCDPVTGDIAMFVVGANSNPQAETVAVLRPGANFGWPYREAETFKYAETERGVPPLGDSYAPIALGNELLPVAYWPKTNNRGSVATGGLYYRGTQWPTVAGKLIAADHGSGRIWAIDYLNAGSGDPTTATTYTNTDGVLHPEDYTVVELLDSNHAIRQMAASPNGQDILIAANSNIWRLYYNGVTNPEPPALLSDTGAFTSLASLTPNPSLIPFSPGAPLWSDRAAKKRWMSIPNNIGGSSSAYDSADEKILFSENGNWVFPEGSVFVKHFALPLDERDPDNPALQKNVETRFVVRGEDGEYFFFGYKWNADDTEANLIPDGDTTALEEDYDYTDIDGVPQTQTWSFPTRAQCFDCHQPAAGSVLGLKTRQLNHFFQYPGSPVSSHQLATLSKLDIFDTSIDARLLSDYITSQPIADTLVSKEDRVRSYLDSNCAHCHQPGANAGLASFDARLTTPLSLSGMINADPHAGDLGATDAHIITPRYPSRSVLWLRDSIVGNDQMPPMGKNLVDEKYIAVLTDWIKRMGLPNFDTWADDLGIPGGPEDDYNQDGIINAHDFLMIRDPRSSEGSFSGVFSETSGTTIVAFPLSGDALADGFSPLIQDSTNLSDWYDAGTSGSIMTPLDDTSEPGIDGLLRWSFLPATQGFVRTAVDIPEP